MNEYRKVFEEYGALHLGQILTKEECDEALLKLFVEKENGNSIKDTMYFDCSFEGGQLDYLLERVGYRIENILDIQLFSTYSYSRIYHKGDILPLHVDRNACEISITITLGYGGKSVWPLVILPKNETLKCINHVGISGGDFPGENINITPDISQKLKKVSANVGDGILYRGIELGHGRDEYIEGDWQAQVFFHFVDANGPNMHHKNDQPRKEQEKIFKGLNHGNGN